MPLKINDAKKEVKVLTFWERIKEKILHVLEKMAAENEKAFGNGKMDCCQLNQEQNSPPK